MKNMETERLLLRPFTLEDAQALHQEIYADREVVRYYSGKGVLTYEQTRQHVHEHLAAWREDSLGRHAVFLKRENAFVGQVDLGSYVNRYYRWASEKTTLYNKVEVELSFAFGQRFWGKGYAFEACTALIEYAFKELRLQRLVGGFDARNIRSGNLQRRLGYHVEENLLEVGNFVTILNNTEL